MTVSTAVDASAVARVVGVQTAFKDLRGGSIAYLPQRIAVLAQGASAATYSATKLQVTSAVQAGETYGYGSPIHLICKELLPVNGDGVGTIPVTIYPLSDNGGGPPAIGTITPSGAVTKAGTFRVTIGGIVSEQFTVAVGDAVADIVDVIVAAINAVIDMPVIATDTTTEATITAKWEGANANGMSVVITGPSDTGVSFATVLPTGATTDAAITSALTQVGDVWETIFINANRSNDVATLAEIAVFGEGRWGALTRKPFVSFHGATGTVLATLSAITGAYKTDRVNALLNAPGSPELPFVFAARAVARIAKIANNNPPRDYGGAAVSGIEPGTDGQQWDYVTRDAAVKAGVSTIEVKDGVVTLSDTVTFYRPTGDPVPAYRYVVDIIKLQQIIFNLDLIFAADSWNGAPLIPDGTPTVNREARKPSAAVAAVAAMVDSLALEAIISDPERAKESIVAEIDSGNPKRLNVAVTVQLSGNTNIISVDLNFGFYFGTSAVVA